MRRSRNSNTPIIDKPVIIDEPNDRILQICEILFWHKYLPSNWIRHHFPTAQNNQNFITILGKLREEQNSYLKWSEWPLNVTAATGRHGVYELAPRGAKAIEHPMPANVRGQEVPHELIVSLHECSLKFQARDLGIPFSFLDPAHYSLPSGRKWYPDGHPIIIGEPGDETIIHSEIERRKYAESKNDTEEKIEKAYEYVKSRAYDSDAKKAVVLFLSTTTGRTETLKRYVEERYTKCSFIGFATTEDWVRERSYPKPHEPLVLEWERVGHPPLNLFQKG